MKGIAKPSLYFSAYPLKAVEQASDKSSSSSPFLRSVLNGNTNKANRARVFPMINPYKNPYQEESTKKMSAIDRVMRKLPDDLRNYE